MIKDGSSQTSSQPVLNLVIISTHRQRVVSTPRQNHNSSILTYPKQRSSPSPATPGRSPTQMDQEQAALSVETLSQSVAQQ